MKNLFAFALLVGAVRAHAVMPVMNLNQPTAPVQTVAGDPFGIQDFLDDMFRPLYDDAAWTPEDERERQADLATSSDPLQFMTPDEIADDMGIPRDYSAQDNAELLWEKSADGVALNINVSIARQTLTMSGTYTPAFSAVVSTGKKGHGTVRGCFRPTTLDINHRSAKYNGSPMNYSVFFHGGYALHETPFVKQLGSPASHGCVRQSRATAKYVFSTVSWYRAKYGNGSIRICVK